MEYGLHTSNAWMIGHNNSIAESRGRFVVCTVEYCTIDSIVNAKVSILVRLKSVVKRSTYYGGSPSRRFAVLRTLEDYSGSNLQPCFFHDGDVKSWPSRNSPARIEPGS